VQLWYEHRSLSSERNAPILPAREAHVKYVPLRRLWLTQVLVAIDHFSRKVTCVVPLEGPNAGWIIKGLGQAMQKHGSIAVTERVIKTLKYEWLRCVPIIKGFDHLTLLCTEFESWYNTWRPHLTLEGLRPDDLYFSRKPETPKREGKTMPGNVERHVFAQIRLTAYRLQNAA
jgi:transposase InsO family protein